MQGSKVSDPCSATRPSHMLSTMFDPITRPNAALKEGYTIKRELGEGGEVSLAGAGDLD